MTRSEVVQGDLVSTTTNEQTPAAALQIVDSATWQMNRLRSYMLRHPGECMKGVPKMPHAINGRLARGAGQL